MATTISTRPGRRAGKTTPPGRRVSFRARLHRDAPLLVMAIPVVLLFVVFTYIPLIGNFVAFFDYAPYLPLSESPFVGLENFQAMFADPAFWNAVSNTLQITALQVVFSFPIPILLAILLHSLLSPVLRGFVQSFVYLPHFLSWVIVIAMFQQLLSGAGLAADLVRSLGGGQINIMANPDTFKLLVTGQHIWKEAGWGTVIFLAALSGIDINLYESAAVDGAKAWGRFWHITLPGLRPVIVLLLILQLGNSLTVGFEQILLQRDTVGAAAAEVLDTYVYYKGVVQGNWGIGIAAGLIKGLVGLGLVLAANKVAHLLGEQGVYSRD